MQGMRGCGVADHVCVPDSVALYRPCRPCRFNAATSIAGHLFCGCEFFSQDLCLDQVKSQLKKRLNTSYSREYRRRTHMIILLVDFLDVVPVATLFGATSHELIFQEDAAPAP